MVRYCLHVFAQASEPHQALDLLKIHGLEWFAITVFPMQRNGVSLQLETVVGKAFLLLMNAVNLWNQQVAYHKCNDE
jgi:hypothetical protein